MFAKCCPKFARLWRPQAGKNSEHAPGSVCRACLEYAPKFLSLAVWQRVIWRACVEHCFATPAVQRDNLPCNVCTCFGGSRFKDWFRMRWEGGRAKQEKEEEATSTRRALGPSRAQGPRSRSDASLTLRPLRILRGWRTARGPPSSDCWGLR